MSLQATEAILLEMDSKGNVVHEGKIKIDLVQRGDILKVLLMLLYFVVQKSVAARWFIVCLCSCHF